MKYLNIFALAVVSMIMLNCTKNDETTVILLGKESYIQDITKVIPDSLQSTFTEHFGMIHEGYIPPKVEGKFVMAKKERVYSNIGASWPLTVVEPNMYFTIKDQHNREANFILGEATETETDTVYICGNDNYFTLYYIEEKVMTYLGFNSRIKRAVLFNGEISEWGIKNLYNASVILEAYDNSGGSIVQYKKGDFFIYKDSDGLSERITE